MKMRAVFSIFLTLSLCLMVTNVPAEDNCSGGTLVSIGGEIDNNAVVVKHPGMDGQYTVGVANLRLSDGQHVVKLNCALFGEPADPSVGYQYDHLLVCNDSQQSEIAFKSKIVSQSVTLEEVLNNSQIENFCRGAAFGFVERNRIDSTRQGKGLFQDASGVIRAVGCLNPANNWANIEVNIGVSGDLCLPYWHW